MPSTFFFSSIVFFSSSASLLLELEHEQRLDDYEG